MMQMASSPVSNEFARREFHDLHPKDQQIKQTKKLCIEKNWQCSIQECLPDEIRPRCEVKKGAKARVGDPDIIEEIWWNWSVELLKSLEELSAMTVGDFDFARELLVIEVEQRQQNPKSAQRKILELLLGDAQRVVDEQRKRAAARYEQDAMGGDDGAAGMTMALEYGGGYAHNYSRPALDHQADFFVEANNHMATVEDAMSSSPPESTQYQPSYAPMQPAGPQTQPTDRAGMASGQYMMQDQMPAHTRQSAVEHLKITELKARAFRLRAEAANFEAQAVQLEVKTRELRAQLAGLE